MNTSQNCVIVYCFTFLIMFLPEVAAQQQSTVPESQLELTQDQGTQLVAAEGVGTTADEALRDAFRDAVRQVVGMFVDAQTQVKNDELIDDRVLTYSDGYVKTYRKVSESSRGGLARIKISALVKQKGLLEKLQSENITVKNVDGKGLFAEAITKMDATKDAGDLLTASLEGFPISALSADVTKPVRNVKTTGNQATIEIEIDVKVNDNAYRSFAKRIVERLEEIADTKGEFTAAFQSEAGPGQQSSFTYFRPQQNGSLEEVMAGWMPKAFTRHRAIRHHPVEDKIVVAVTLSRTARGDRWESRYYLLEPEVGKQLIESMRHEVGVKLSLLDDDDNAILTDRVDAKQRLPWNTNEFLAKPMSVYGMVLHQHWYIIDTTENAHDEYQTMIWFHPGFTASPTNQLMMIPKMTMKRELTLSLDEIKSISRVKCEIYQP